MRLSTLLRTFVVVALFAVSYRSAAQSEDQVFKQAMEYYDNGMYARARTMFESFENNPLAEGYAVLCSMKLHAFDAERLYELYRIKYVSSAVEPEICLQFAKNLFDEKRFQEAETQFSRLDVSKIPLDEKPEVYFKHGYCYFAIGNYSGARSKFSALENLQANDYSASGRYFTAYMDYCAANFSSAAQWFRFAQTDPRFEDLCRFYIVDCEFNMKNYDYVLSEGLELYSITSKERQAHLARMISEAYLIRGDKEHAREYYEFSSRDDMNRSDFFYAGSVLYAVEDYAGAIENFTKMTDRSDSLGQIANYELANSYIRSRKNVAAMDAFKDASSVSFDRAIQEDAFFNYAKLAFDLNKDTSGFAEYIKRYSTTARGDMIYSYMALAALYNRDYSGAVEAYDHIDELTPDMRNNYTKANFLRGEQLVRRGAYSDAIPCLRASAYYLPRTDRLHQYSKYWLGECQYNTGDYSEAKETFTEIYNSSVLEGTTEGEILPYNVGYCYYLLGNYPMASRWFDNYISQGARYYREDALLRRADCDFASRNYKEAIASYQKVLNEFSSVNDIYPYYQQALAYGLSGDRNGKKKKVEVLSRVEDASPDAPMYDEALYELGRARTDMKNNSEAVKTFHKLRNTTKDSIYVAKALIGLGMVNRNVKEYERALGYYKEVVSMLPGSEYAEDAMLAIESIYQAMKQPQKYLEYVESNSLLSKKSASDKEMIYFNTAEQVFLGGDASSAIVSLQRFIEEFPQSEKLPQAWFYIGESYKSLGEKEKARDAYAKVLDSSSEGSFFESARLGYADISYSLERYSDAYQAYSNLFDTAKIESNRTVAAIGGMRSAFRARDYNSAIMSAEAVQSRRGIAADIRREADYVTAKSLLATSRRNEAMKKFADLALSPSTDEGAEAKFILIQDIFDTGDFDKVERAVYEFSQTAGDQSYWLAKSYIILGDAFLEKGMTSQAKATFESIRDGYEPSGSSDDVLDNVKIRLQRLQSE